MSRARYRDRREAGDVLGVAVASRLGSADAVVLGLPRGGVPVAALVAAALGAPLDVVVVRKIGVPWQPELAMGAVAVVENEVEVVCNEAVLQSIPISQAVFDAAARTQADVALVRQHDYRVARPPVPLAARVAVLVDDGLATGATMRAAIAAVRRRGPAPIVVAAAVGSPETCAALAIEAVEVVCPFRPTYFRAVGEAYRDFSATQDAEVRALLAE